MQSINGNDNIVVLNGGLESKEDQTYSENQKNVCSDIVDDLLMTDANDFEPAVHVVEPAVTDVIVSVSDAPAALVISIATIVSTSVSISAAYVTTAASATSTKQSKQQKEYIKRINELYDNPQSSDSEKFRIDSDDSSITIARKRKARSKALKRVPPKRVKDDNDIPYYFLHDCPITEPWMQFSKNQLKAMKKKRKFDKGSSHHHHPPPPPSPDAGTGGGPFPYKLKEIVTSRAPPDDTINRYEPSDPFEDPVNNPLSWTVRMKELAALDQIKKVREHGKDTSNITTLSEQRKKELERYSLKKFFDPESYMKLHPEAVVPRPKYQTSLGDVDDRRSKKEALNPTIEILFKKREEKE
ncbi:hypothetical protein KSP39_PZI007275 [Platanthera zijinensis]|uniref:Uncharacterized protein n=1 Tax=Platanthera zijinensis TaxID=2320716 RepID=A0AAP0BPB2_9ASPA